MTLLKVNEAAKYLNVHPNTVRRLIKTGELHATRLGPKTIRIRLSDLEALGGKNA